MKKGYLYPHQPPLTFAIRGEVSYSNDGGLIGDGYYTVCIMNVYAAFDFYLSLIGIQMVTSRSLDNISNLSIGFFVPLKRYTAGKFLTCIIQEFENFIVENMLNMYDILNLSVEIIVHL